MARILMLDDDHAILELFSRALSEEGHDVFAETAANEAIDCLVKNKLDLVIMDLCVPGESGLSFLKSLPNSPENRVPVIIFSGAIDEKTRAEALTYGVKEIIEKPTEISILREKVKKVLAEQEAEEAEDKILIVDDDEAVRMLLDRYFKRKGLRTFLASGGQEALSIIKTRFPNLVFLDVRMPEMSGLETLEKIRAINPSLQVVMATGLNDEGIAKEAMTKGACDYLVKPFDMKYLDKVTAAHLILS